ncbi:MAG: bifunctional folylpolyglutamate synthase/dihydrofolate synthase [Candidatus Izimaplasma sp.]|nr:bifunctional folylpolyglutamate synthase/dihydrofolate synthase [Candidatus Izimaplasma bacterium]
MFNKLDDAIVWIESIKRFGDKYDLSRMELACEILGNPENDLNVIHVAGTNGKGSTVSYLKHILLSEGYNVGTFTSPYIVSFNERITYNYDDITSEELLYYINKVYSLHYEVLDKYNDAISFFELLTLISLLYFKDKQCDYIIYEVGLGGRLDATNIVKPIITAITNINFDHMYILGNTLEEISLCKLGIVKDKIPLVTSEINPDLLEIFKDYTNNKNAELTIVSETDITNRHYGEISTFEYKNVEYAIKMIGTHQIVNASLAIEIITQLNKIKKTSVSLSNIKLGLSKTNWPGRLETFGNIILDGAHNIGGVTVLKDSMLTLYKDKYIKVLFTSMADKEYFDVIKVLETFAHEIHFTDFDYPRCESAKNLYDVSSHPLKYLESNIDDALKSLKDLKDNEILLITGSLYFISLVRKKIK